jgi:hypothetical protein
VADQIGAHHLTPESILATIADLRAVSDGTESVPLANRDHRTRAGVLAIVIEALFTDRELPASRALAELVNKICPGLYSGDLLVDAKTASAKLDAFAAMAQLLTDMLEEFEDHPTVGTTFWTERIRAAIAAATGAE